MLRYDGDSWRWYDTGLTWHTMQNVQNVLFCMIVLNRGSSWIAKRAGPVGTVGGSDDASFPAILVV